MILKTGFRAPDFRIATVGGVSRALHDYRGRPVLLFGWGSWHASRESLPLLQRFHEKHGEEVRIVSIAFDAQGPGFAMRYLKPAGATFEMLLDATCVLSRAWGAKRLPFVVLLDSEGTVLHLADALDESVLSDLRSALKKRVQKKGDLRVKRAKGATKVDILVQGCAIFLSRSRTADAANSLREALKLDPGNEIIRGQVEAVVKPESVYR